MRYNANYEFSKQRWDFMRIGIAIVLSAIGAFAIGSYFGQPLHWYLFVLLLVTGFIIQMIILVLKTDNENR